MRHCHGMCLSVRMQTLFVGVGADEQLAGYSRHRTKFRYMAVAIVQMYHALMSFDLVPDCTDEFISCEPCHSHNKNLLIVPIP